MRSPITLLLFLTLSFAALPSLADAAVWKEGTASSPFTLTSTGGLLVLTDGVGDPSLTPPYEAATVFSAVPEFEPRSVRVASDGSYVVACGKHGYVVRIRANGHYDLIDGTDIPGLERPFDAFPLDDGGMLIVDRGATQGAGRVLRVDSSHRVVWHYGGTSGLGAGQVWDPFSAEPVGASGSHTLIADSLGYRVIEINNTTGAIVWSYGTFRVQGPGPGLLVRPHSAQRLSNGNTLICDSEEQRIIEVSPDKRIVWSYGTGTQGSGPGQVKSPNSARRLANGNTLICDSDNGRVIEVTRQGTIAEVFSMVGRTPEGGSLADPRAAVRLQDGSTIIADLGNTRLARYRYRPHREWVATSGMIDPAIGKMKWFSRIDVSATRPAGSLVAVEYTTDGHDWVGVPSAGVLSGSAKGSAIGYRIRMTTASGDAAPVVKDVSITWSDTAPTTGKGPNGGSTHSTGTGTANGEAATGTGSSGGTSNTGAASGSGYISTATVVPGGLTGGTAGADGSLSGSGGDAVTQSTTMSGWVMKEVQDEAGGAIDAFGAGGVGSGSTLQRSTTPGVALLFVAYTLGLAWSPAARVLVNLVATAMTH